MDDIDDQSLNDYSIVFYMEGIARHFEYYVSKDTSERVREALEDEETGNLIFAAYRPAQQIVVNSRFVQFVHFR
jgi:hypothetical protein